MNDKLLLLLVILGIIIIGLINKYDYDHHIKPYCSGDLQCEEYLMKGF